jgi:ESS family glutamate:Na+ symporter
LKKYHIPAALIAGIIGLILGPYFIGLIPKEATGCWSGLSGRLIVIVFAPMLMGKSGVSGKSVAKKALGSVIWSYNATCMQYAFPLLLGALLLKPLFGVHDLFGTIVEQGWAGGHGTAGGMAIVFEELKWMDGQSLAVTSATAGLVVGIVGGVVIINVGVRRGWTAFLKQSAGLSNEENELFTQNKPVGSREAINPGVINNFAFHAALISIAMFFGWIINKLLKAYLNFSVSSFVTPLFGGLILWKCIEKTRWGGAVDKGTLNNIQGLSLEFLVAGAVASVNVPVVIAYAVPLIIQQVGIAAIMLFLNLWFARRVFGEYWFENSMALFGTYTGVAATGLLLLKTCDPEVRSDALEVYAARAPFTGWALGGGVLTSMTPVWVMQFGPLKCGLVYLAGALVTFFLPRLIGIWFPVNKPAAVPNT